MADSMMRLVGLAGISLANRRGLSPGGIDGHLSGRRLIAALVGAPGRGSCTVGSQRSRGTGPSGAARLAWQERAASASRPGPPAKTGRAA